MTLRRKPLSTAAAIDEILRRRTSRSVVSVVLTLDTVRSLAPGCELTDDELAELIVRLSIAKGCNISFDYRHPEVHPPGG